MQRKPFPDLVLWGLPGCGKSTVGKVLAETIGKSLLDLDDYIEKISGIKSAEWIQQKGVASFREFEKERINELYNATHIVISLGGGTVTIPGIADRLREKFLCIWLRRDPDLIANALTELESRPLLKNDPSTLYELLLQREQFYKQAHLIVDNDDTPEDCVKRIIRVLEKDQSSR